GSGGGNGFVPRLWASLAIDQLERTGQGADRPRIVALSQGYGVLSRETSLLVLESAAMFDAFGIDHRAQGTAWTGEDKLDEVESAGTMQLDEGKAALAGHSSGFGMNKKLARSAVAKDKEADDGASLSDAPATTAMRDIDRKAPAPKPAATKAAPPSMPPQNQRMRMVPMRRVWERVPAVTSYDGVN